MWIHSHSSSKIFLFHSHPKTSPKTSPKITCSIWKCRKQFGSKRSLSLLKNDIKRCWKKHCTHPGKRSRTKTIPNSLANAKHAASEFRKRNNGLSMSFSIKLLCMYHAKSRKPSKTSRSQIWCHHSASNSELSTTVTLLTPKEGRQAKFTLSHSTCSPYARECIFPYPLCYELPIRQLPSSEAQKSARRMQICIFQSSAKHRED